MSLTDQLNEALRAAPVLGRSDERISEGPLTPVDLFKKKEEAGIGEMYLDSNKEGEAVIMMKVDEKWLNDSLKFWQA